MRTWLYVEQRSSDRRSDDDDNNNDDAGKESELRNENFLLRG